MWGVSYWVFPVISALCWLGMLMGLLIDWNVIGKPRYPSMGADQKIAYISDVGADKLKPLFIAGSCVTTVFLDLAFLSERWLRHKGRLAANISVAEKVLSGLSIVFAIIGTAGLILLSIFDTLRHPTLHDIFLLLFIGGYIISAIFTCAEYQRLGIHFRQHAILRNSFWIKLTFIVIEAILAIAFAVCNFRDEYDVAAILEWAVSFVFTFYVLSFVVDLAPAVKTKHSNTKFGQGPGETEMQMEQNDVYSQSRENVAENGTGYDQRHTAESQRTLGANDVRTVNGVKYVNGQPVPSNF